MATGSGPAPVDATPGGNTPVNSSAPILSWKDTRLDKQPWRKRIFAIIGKVFPMAVAAAQLNKPCNPPKSAGPLQGTYNSMPMWSEGLKGTSCTAVTTNLGGKYSGKEKERTWGFDAWTADAWVPYSPGALPSIGDVYLLYNDYYDGSASGDNAAGLRHCGFVAEVAASASAFWCTADGGQNDNPAKCQCAQLSKRPWKMAVPRDNKVRDQQHKLAKPTMKADNSGFIEYPFLGGGAESDASNSAGWPRLIGWLDMNDNSIPPGVLDADYTEAHFKIMCARIEAVMGRGAP
jgi:hypothetical protein